MCRGTAGSVSSLRRSSATCVSTVRLNTAALYPHTSVSSSMRLATAPPRRSSATSRSNSFGVSATGRPLRSTERDAGMTSTAPNCSGSPAPSAGGGAAQQGFHSRQELEHAERLRDVIVRPQTQAANLVGLFAARGEDEDGHPAPLVAQRAQHAVAVQPRQHQIENHQVGPCVTRAGEPLGAVLHDDDLVALDLEVVAQPEGEVGVVFDDEDPGHAVAPASARTVPAPDAAWASGTSGSSITNRLPARSPRCDAGASSTQVRPPCSATSSRTTDRPMPVPATAEPRSRSSRQNRSQMRSRAAAGIPGPSSSTETRARPSARVRPRVTVWRDGPYFTALSSRLRSI